MGVQYFSLRNALTQTDVELASTSAKALHNSISEHIVNDKVLIDQPEGEVFLMGTLKAIERHSLSIGISKDIEFQRANFESISEAMIELLTAFGTEDHTYYVQHCPMVDKNRGADWISTEKEI